ncbi:MAG: hypothetical protein SGARI_004776, partial [Bacillariaceae sp.]
MVWLGTSNVMESLEDHMAKLAIAYPFGCQTNSKGLFRKQYADGILGLSLHDSSIIRAMYLENLIPRNAFSLCFTPDGGHMALGGMTSKHHHEPMKMTPITREHGYYSIEVVSVSVGDTVVVSESVEKDLLDDINGGKGCIFDSGTTDSFFLASLQPAFSKAALEHTNGLTDFSSKMRRHLYSFAEFQRLPIVTVEFANSASISILPDHYMEGLSLDPTTGKAKPWEKSIPLTNRIYLDEPEGSVLGANAMYGYDVLFDVQGHQIGVAPADCFAAS